MKTLTHSNELLLAMLALAVCCAVPLGAAQAQASAGQPGASVTTQRASETPSKTQAAATAPPSAQATMPTPLASAPSSASSTVASPSPASLSAVEAPAQPPPSDDARLTFLDETRGGEASEPAPSALSLMARTLGALCLIVGLIFAASWGLRHFGGARFGQAGERAAQLSVLSSVSLGDKRSLAVVKFGGRVLLIGSTGQAITLLAEDEDEGAAQGDATPPARSVADLLARDAAAFEREFVWAGERLEGERQAFGENAGAGESAGEA